MAPRSSQDATQFAGLPVAAALSAGGRGKLDVNGFCRDQRASSSISKETAVASVSDLRNLAFGKEMCRVKARCLAVVEVRAQARARRRSCYMGPNTTICKLSMPKNGAN